jgi:allophanate hydrolase
VEADPVRLNSNLGHYTNFMNLLDLAAWAVPAGFLPGKLPWGITFFAPAFEDRFLGTLASRFHAGLKLPLGMMPRRSDEVESLEDAPDKNAGRWIKIGVCGAHMEGLGLNHQLTSRGGRKVCTAKSAAKYRLYLLPGSGPVPDRPGMVKVAEQGAALDMEIWELPEHTVGSFVDAVSAPLGFGRVELVDGTSVCGFLCEPVALKPELEITQYGGWRTWLAREK